MNKEAVRELGVMFAKVSLAIAIGYPLFLLAIHWMVVAGEWFHGRSF